MSPLFFCLIFLTQMTFLSSSLLILYSCLNSSAPLSYLISLSSPLFRYYPPSSTVIPRFSCFPCFPSQLPLLSSVLPCSLLLSSPIQQKTGRLSFPVSFYKQIKLWCQQDTNHMPVQRCSNAIYTHYKALSCDHGSMLIKQLCEDRAGKAALSQRAKRRDKTAA